MHVVNGGTERRRRYSKVVGGGLGCWVEAEEGGGAEGEECGEYGGEEGRGRGRACLVCVCARQASPVNGPGRRSEGEEGVAQTSMLS